MCRLLLNKPHNGQLVVLFPDVTHAEFCQKVTGVYYWVRLRRNPFVFDLTIAKKLVAYTAKGAKWKFKCLVHMAYLPVAAL